MGSGSGGSPPAICCLLRNLTPGGVPRAWIELLRRHVALGGRATIVAEADGWDGQARAAGIAVVPVAWDAADGAALREVLGDHEATIAQWDPAVLARWPELAPSCRRSALALHSSPHRLPAWFGVAAHRDALALGRAAVARPDATVLTCGAHHRRAAARMLGADAAALDVVPAATTDGIAFAARDGEPRSVLALVRLSPEKISVVRLAVALVRARLADGHDCELTLAGDGPGRDEALALCARELPRDAWRHEPPPPDAHARLAAADVAVTQGLTTLEAGLVGCRTAVARRAGVDGAGGIPLTPRTYASAAQDAFSFPPLTRDPRRLWGELAALDVDDLRAVRALVERENAIGPAVAALHAALARLAER